LKNNKMTLFCNLFMERPSYHCMHVGWAVCLNH